MARSFNADEPIAYFITWTTYGTWLPGDERGWHRENVPGVQSGDSTRKHAAQLRMTDSAFVMSDLHRSIVEQTIRRHCEIRNWWPHAINPRTNHVHVVVSAPSYNPKIVREQFQAWCTRMLKRVVQDRVHFWTEGGSERYVNNETELERVVQYVLEAQDLKFLDE